MSTEIAVRAATLPEKMQYAEALAYSGMLPEQYRKQPANVLWAVEYGETIGITAMAAITGVHMIEGKPTASAALISGLVRRAGHKLRSGYDPKTRTGWAEIVRCDDPDFTFRSEWNLDRAVEAELVQVGPKGELIAKDSKGRSKPWKKFYPSMTKARAITEVARDACEEVLFGLHYTPEELGADTDDEGNLVVRAARAAWTAEQEDPWQTPAPAAPVATAAEPVEYAEEVEERPAAATSEQVASILAALQAQGVNDRKKALAIIGKHAGREISAPADLTWVEADRVVAQLAAPPPEQQPETAPVGPAPVGTPDNPRHTPSQMKMIQATLNEKGIEDPQAKRDLIGRILGVRIERVRDLSRDQASKVIEHFRTGEIPAPAPLVERLAAQMRAAQSSEELADHSEWMWRAHEAGELSQAEVSKLQDVSLAREAELAQTARAAA